MQRSRERVSNGKRMFTKHKYKVLHLGKKKKRNVVNYLLGVFPAFPLPGSVSQHPVDTRELDGNASGVSIFHKISYFPNNTAIHVRV